MGTWAQLVGGDAAGFVSNSRSFVLQDTHATGESAPVTSHWLSETLAAVQDFQVEDGVAVSASLDVGAVVVSTPRTTAFVDQCGEEGSGVLCTALVPSLIIASFLVAMFVVALVTHRNALRGGCSRFIRNVNGKFVPEEEEGSSAAPY